MQAGTVESEESRSELVKSEMFVWSQGGEIKSGEECRHEFRESGAGHDLGVSNR